MTEKIMEAAVTVGDGGSKAFPEPLIAVMYDQANLGPSDYPAWGPFGSWMWWGWDALEPGQGNYNWAVVDKYLDAAAELGNPVALSVMLYPGPNLDLTPKWVYGGGAGWAGTDSAGGTFTYPKWNDAAWDAAFQAFVAAFGAKYDGDPRVHSVWIATLLYGETVITQPGGGALSHNPTRFVLNAIDWYSAAFAKTPLFIMNTGTTDRKAISEYAWAKDVNVKFNGLVRDAANQVMVKPTPGGGLMELAQEALEMGRPTAWEHFYNGQSQGETYWAMLTGLANGMHVLDLPVAHLQTLAGVELPGFGKLWEWALSVMGQPLDRVAMWVARDTAYPPPGNGWEYGWPGPWVRGGIQMSSTVQVGAPGSLLHKSLPAELAGSLFAYGGAGLCNDPQLAVALDLPVGDYSILVIWSPTGAPGWQATAIQTTLAGPTTMQVAPGPCWVHAVIITPADDAPVPPSQPDPIEALRAEFEQEAVDVDARLDELDKKLDGMRVALE